MIALLLLALASEPAEPVRQSDPACEAEYVKTCLQESDDPDCSVPCQYVPDKCRLAAIVYKKFKSSPQALIRVDYLNEDCGAEPPRIESKTAIIHAREVYEGEAPECWDIPKLGASPEDPCENGCPCLSFMAWVRGLPGTHFLQVWAENEGYSGLQVELGRGRDLASEKDQ